MKTLRFVLAGLSLLGATGASAEIWKWVDEAGRVNYGETAPVGRDAVRIRESAEAATDEPADGSEPELIGEPAAESESEPSLESEARDPVDAIRQRAEDFERERLDRGRQRAEDQARTEQERRRHANCERARSNMESLTSRGQASVREGDDYRVLSEEERQSQIGQMQKFLDEQCGDTPPPNRSAAP